MGTWGAGNFEDDTAADHLSIVTDRLINEIREAMSGDPVELEPDEYWGVAVPCNLDLLAVIARQRYCGAMLPDVETITEWKRRYLAVWDEAIDGLGPTPEYRQRRRAVIVETFDQVARLAEEREAS